MKVIKKHKMYVRPNSKNDSIRNLAKLSPELYIFVFEQFTKKGAEAKYQSINKDVKHWKDYKPVDIFLSENMSNAMRKITKKENITVYYNGSWRPLARLNPKTQQLCKQKNKV